MALLTMKHLIACAEFVAPFLAEFLGTFLVVLTASLNMACGDTLWMPTSIAFATMIAMYASSSMPVGHYNPAITVAFTLCGKLEWTRCVQYCVVQMLSGLCAGLVSWSISPTWNSMPLLEATDWLTVAIINLVFSTLVCFVALNCMASLRNCPGGHKPEFFAVAVAFVTIAGGQSIGGYMGGFFNPAISLGLSWAGATNVTWLRSLINIIVQFISSLSASILFLLARPDELWALGEANTDGGDSDVRSAFSALRLGWRSRATDSTGGNGERASEGGDTVTEPQPSEQTLYGEVGSRLPSIPPIPAKAFVEFLGSFYIVCTFSFAAQDLHNTGGVAPPPWAIGAVMVSLVYSVADVSGGYFNPAISLGVFLTSREKLPLADTTTYIIAQAIGSFAGGVLGGLMQLRTPLLIHVKLGPQPGYHWHAVILYEAIFTCFVVLVFTNMRTVSSPRYFNRPLPHCFQFGLAIGMSVFAAGISLSHVSAGCVNPVVVFGVNVANYIGSNFDNISPDGHYYALIMLWYIVSEVCGSVLAAIMFRLNTPYEYKRDPLVPTEPIAELA